MTSLELNQLLNTVFTCIIIPVIPMVGVFIVRLIESKLNEINVRVENEQVKKYLKLAMDTLVSAVNATTETYVKSLKEQNKFDMDAQKIAFEQTKDAFLKTISEETLKTLQVAYGDYNEWIKITTEKLLKDEKIQ